MTLRHMILRRWAVILALLHMPAVAAFASEEASPPERMLRYDEPAEDWQSEALPLGNGRLGCMVFGGVERERIQFNEDSLWIGDESDTGSYQAFGNVFVDFFYEGDPAEVSGYERRLDIRRGVYAQEFKQGGVTYRREYFVSHPAQVMVFRFSADRPGALTGRVTLVDSHGAAPTREGAKLSCRGDLRGFVYGEEKRRAPEEEQYRVALRYASSLVVSHEGGEVASDGDGSAAAIEFNGCDSVTILLGAVTNFVRDRRLGWTGELPLAQLNEHLSSAAARPYEELRDEHVVDFESLMGRFSIDVGDSPAEVAALPTDERVQRYNAQQPDHDLEELQFQFARYLMVSSSRPGDQPANLQGVWNESNNPPWRSDYHSDVNTQMNYWFTHPANLADCFTPLAEWVYSIREVRRDATFVTLGKPGWALRAENGLFGGSTWQWSKGDASWLAQNLWDHYAFTLDEEYLRERVYPVQRDLCEFWLADLKELPDGRLVSPNGFSPEHGPHEDGVSFDQQLIWDLFTNTIETTEVLDVDPEFRAELLDKRSRLLGPQIGEWGQLQEWMVDRDDPNDKHRHFSHMIAVFPGRQIAPDETPELAEAARVSLEARADGSTGWSKAWKIAVWARLHEGERAYHMLGRMFIDGAAHGRKAASSNLDAQAGGFLGNLLDTHPPFQIDGNFGYAAGVSEMLLQSHLGYLHLLPALPMAWSEGSASGICARGGFELDLQWRGGKLATGKIRSKAGGVCRLRVAEPVAITCDGREVTVEAVGDNLVFETKVGGEYQITAAE